jgi:hypothetical protein
MCIRDYEKRAVNLNLLDKSDSSFLFNTICESKSDRWKTYRYIYSSSYRNNMNEVAVVTGSSSGIGYETSLLLARNQIITYAPVRNIGKSDRLREIASKENIPLNVTHLYVNDDSSVKNAIDNIIKENNGIDVLVNNAGYDFFWLS